jgi:very-short-patch-repair endonuclease
LRDQILLQRAKAMRREPTPFEHKLWLALRAKRFNRAKLRQQVVIDRYIVDFACRIPCMLVVEVDGDTHAVQPDYDAKRTALLEARGYEVLRFTNREVATNFEGVLMTIADALNLSLSPSGERSAADRLPDDPTRSLAGERGSPQEADSPSPSASFGRSLLSPEGERK